MNEYKGEDGYVLAPAGYGKTESICELLASYPMEYRVLILTHTNAGVNSIQDRIHKKFNIKCIYKVYTIASFCLMYVKNFPILSNFNDFSNYNDIYKSMDILLGNKCIKNIILKSYDEFIIDEYQDCNMLHSEIIKKINAMIPVKLLGDPLQAIYDFDGKLVDFDQLNETKKELFKLETPWRWKDNIELGKWLMNSREKLLKYEKVDYSIKPSCVKLFNFSDISGLIRIGYEFLRFNGRCVMLFKDDFKAISIAKYFKGAFQIQEEIECKTLIKLLQFFDDNKVEEFLKEFFEIVKKTFINSSTEFKTIISKIQMNNFNSSRLVNNKDIMDYIIKIRKSFFVNDIISLMNIIEKNSNIINCRKELWLTLKKVFKVKLQNSNEKMENILRTVRKNDFSDVSYNLISRILLVKGLAFENVMLVIDKDSKLNVKQFYVAITRATNNLWIVVEK